MLKKSIAIFLSLIILSGLSLTAFAGADDFVAKYTAVQAAFENIMSDYTPDPSSSDPAMDFFATLMGRIDSASAAVTALKNACDALSPEEITEINALDPEMITIARSMVDTYETLQSIRPFMTELFELATVFETINKEETWANHTLLNSLIADLDSKYNQLAASSSTYATALAVMEISISDLLSDIANDIDTVKSSLRAAQDVYDKIEKIGTVTLAKESQIVEAYEAAKALSTVQLAYITNIDTLADAMDDLNGLKKYQTGTTGQTGQSGSGGSGVANPRTGIISAISLALLALAGSLVLILRKRTVRAQSFQYLNNR